jgi:2-polyprenyl-6-methoxyphenol hydroxylase-like FAD-dependent oxidoreductase
MDKTYSVGIIGGGVSGVVTALHLANAGVDTVLFEQKPSLINGPPFCHLHAGGNLYPDITEDECRILLKQSIEMARLFPQSIDQRPTLISIPKSHSLSTNAVQKRLEMLQDEYAQLIKIDPENAQLGVAEDYFKAYSHGTLQALAQEPLAMHPATQDQWMRNALECLDLAKLKTPVFLVQEYGWNMFRLAAQAKLALEESEHCQVKCATKVSILRDVHPQPNGHNWEIQTNRGDFRVRYLVNASGFQSRIFEDKMGIAPKGWTEFKASYLARWSAQPCPLPELVFHGERGTPEGMAQLTPYEGGYFQIHGMSEGISLFSGGLQQSSAKTPHPSFSPEIMSKLSQGWDPLEAESRTAKAIEYLGHFVKGFQSAVLGGPPLYGAQQITGVAANSRVAEVSFPLENYARIETIKASSALSAARKILEKVRAVSPKSRGNNPLLDAVPKDTIDQQAQQLTKTRGIPEQLSRLMVQRLD